MQTKFNKKRRIIAVLIILVPLNLFSYFLLKENMGRIDILEHAESQAMIDSLQQKIAFGNIFTATVLTLDLVCILFFLYLLFKFSFKTLKNNPQ